MYWKFVNLDFFKNISIRTQLTLFYSLAAFTLLTVITLFLYWETINVLHKTDYQFLNDEVEALQFVLEGPHIDMDALNQAVIESPTQSSSSIYRYFIRIYEANNHIMIETPGADKVFPTEIFTTKTSGTKNFRRYSNHKINYLVIHAPVKINNKYGVIQIALDTSYQHDVMSDRTFLMIALFISAVCSLFIGFYVSHRGMRSLYSLTTTVKQITATSLHQRIDPRSLPKELKPLGWAFNKMLDRLESSVLRLKQFSSDLAHELRIPVNNLIGETEITLSRTHSIEEYQQVLISNMEEYHRIAHLIENILFLSRAENPQLELQKTLLNIHDEISVACEYYQAMADEKNILVSYDGKASLEANSIMFRRMICNLLSNAIKYNQPGGWVRFNITDLDRYHVQIHLSDNGIGIPLEHQSKIFDRFYRVDSARSQQSGGVGLGLAIVKSIVDLHRGNISITSNTHSGTQFCLTFPK